MREGRKQEERKYYRGRNQREENKQRRIKGVEGDRETKNENEYEIEKDNERTENREGRLQTERGKRETATEMAWQIRTGREREKATRNNGELNKERETGIDN